MFELIVKPIPYPLDVKHRQKQWCSRIVEPYGASPLHKHLARGCRRKAHYLVNGAAYCELHAGMVCLPFLVKEPF